MVKKERVIYLRNGMLIDGNGGEPIPDAAVLIRGSIIEAVGEVGEIAISETEKVETIDVSGKTIMPGMVECHSHLTFHQYINAFDIDARYSIEYNTVLAVKNAEIFLESGFTTIRDVGCRGNIAVAIRDAVDAGLIPGT